MGGSPGLVGYGLQEVEYPPGERVDNLKKIEDAFIFSQIAGKRNWEEFFETFFSEDYPNPDDLAKVVKELVRRVKYDFPSLPRKVMERYRQDQHLNLLAK